MNDLSRMKLLINLAKVDGQVADKEKNHLINIGRANGIYPDEIYPLFTQTHQVIVPEHLSDDQKFDLIFSREEIVFCGDVAARLGYNKQVMFELLAHVKSAGMEDEEKESLRQLTHKFLPRQAK